MAVAPGWAAQWTITPALDASVIYSDNIDRETIGNEISDFMTLLVPRVSARTRGARFDADIDYRLEAIFFLENSENDDYFHQLQADTTTEVATETLFLDAGVAYTQTSLSSGDVDSNTQLTGQRGDVGTVVVSPYWQQNYFGTSESELRYTLSKVEYEDVGTSDSVTQELNFYLRTADRAARTQYALTFDAQDTNYETADDFITRIVEARIIYLVSPRLNISGAIGYEKNDYVTLPDEPDPEGELWNVGFSWASTGGALLEASYGERYFGHVGYLLLARNTSRTALSVEYDEELTSEAQRRRDEGVVTRTDPVGEELEEGEFPGTGINRFTTTDEPFIERRLTFNFARLNSRTVLGASVFGANRDFVSSSDEETVVGIDASWNWNFAPTYNSLVGLSTQKIITALDAEDDGDLIWIMSAGVGKDLRPNLSTRLDYQHFRRDSDTPTNEYRENRIEAGLFATF